MNLLRTARLASHVALTACLGLGCGDDDDGTIIVETGVLTLDWTVDGLADPAECVQGNAKNTDVVVTTLGGAFVGEYIESCSAFLIRIELDPGSYKATAVLLDPAGADRTTTVDVGAFTIFGRDELSLSIDFPADSFY